MYLIAMKHRGVSYPVLATGFLGSILCHHVISYISLIVLIRELYPWPDLWVSSLVGAIRYIIYCKEVSQLYMRVNYSFTRLFERRYCEVSIFRLIFSLNFQCTNFYRDWIFSFLQKVEPHMWTDKIHSVMWHSLFFYCVITWNWGASLSVMHALQ